MRRIMYVERKGGGHDTAAWSATAGDAGHCSAEIDGSSCGGSGSSDERARLRANFPGATGCDSAERDSSRSKRRGLG